MDALGNELNRLLVGTYRAAGKIEEIMLDDLSGGKLSLSEMRLIECVGSGRRRGRTVTELSQDLDITLPSVTAPLPPLTAPVSGLAGCPKAKKFLYLVRLDVRGPDFDLNEQNSGPYTNAVYYTRSIWLTRNWIRLSPRHARP